MIEVSNLSKNFGNIKAVDDVSFNVNIGEVLGFLGPNGAGKSTTMKIITCFLKPSDGDVKVAGHSIHEDPISVKRKIGYMPENAPLYEDMTVVEFLQFVCEMRNIDLERRPSSIDGVITKCHLENVKNQSIETLSKGFKRRVSMAQALIHDPEVLILDEPTDGLDPNQKHDVRALIKELSNSKCIILSTHILEEVEAVCTRAIIISSGKKLFDGTPSELSEKSADRKVDDVFRAITTSLDVEGVTL
ncbi:MAG: ABC transporter ATP-binding protein [Bacteriovoracaceae bacterium]|jgi:ABC-2 type transport system ATP-binding protein|nr:ABC transporter ATP-binding protein [Bacteriovoracaceae bacterium]